MSDFFDLMQDVSSDEKVLVKSERFSFKEPIKRELIVLAIFIVYAIISTLKNGHFYPLPWIVCIGILLAIILILVFIELSFKNTQLVITDKRSFGIGKFDKRIDLPLDSISAVSTRGKYSLRISTSSGLIIFSMIKNRDDMHKVLTDLLVERQNKKNEPEVKVVPVETVVNSSDADELSKFKKLLDDGVITQEEFDAKKKQILGL